MQVKRTTCIFSEFSESPNGPTYAISLLRSIKVQIRAKYVGSKSVTSHLLTSETMFPLLKAYVALSWPWRLSENGEESPWWLRLQANQ